MIKILLFDLARVFLFPKNETYNGGLNDLYEEVNSEKDFRFEKYYFLYKEQLNYVKTFKEQYGLYMFTSEFIQNDPEVKPKLQEVFKEIFSAMDLGLSKKDPEAYKQIAKILKVNANEIWFTDDNLKNIEAAKAAGMHAKVYINFEKLKSDLVELGL